jgi:hypothetical protein
MRGEINDCVRAAFAAWPSGAFALYGGYVRRGSQEDHLWPMTKFAPARNIYRG